MSLSSHLCNTATSSMAVAPRLGLGVGGNYNYCQANCTTYLLTVGNCVYMHVQTKGCFTIPLTRLDNMYVHVAVSGPVAMCN